MRPEPEMVWDVPAGLIACRANGQQRALAAISPRALWLRAPEPVPTDARLELSFYDPESGNYNSLPVYGATAGPTRRLEGAVLTRFCFEDPACAAAVRRALNDYARCVELRGGWGATAYGEALTGYPVEEDERFFDHLDDQRADWFRSLSPLPDPGPRELAVALDCPELYSLYLSCPLPDFWNAYADLRRVPRAFFPNRPPDRLYLGNPHCRFLFPDAKTLRALADKAYRERRALSLVTAELRGGDEAHADALLRFAAELGAECVANDWGMLERARRLSPRPVLSLGVRLNRRRKDPRLAWKAGAAEHIALLRQNSLNDPSWRAWLRDFGVARYEYERCGYDCAPPGGAPCSLHLPFYQTNTALWCPLKALCERGDRGAQAGARDCPRWCESNALLYPAHLKLAGRWNSLIALDDRPWDEAAMAPFDRWVLNF